MYNKLDLIDDMTRQIKQCTVKCQKCKVFIDNECRMGINDSCDIDENIRDTCEVLVDNDYDKVDNERVFRLQFTFGDDVYLKLVSTDNYIMKAEITEIEFFEKIDGTPALKYGWTLFDKGDIVEEGTFSIEDIGKTVFLTYEEAKGGKLK